MITLAELATNSGDKLKEGFINELITDSFLLNRMPFDNCLTANGTSDLVYSYKRVKEHKSASFRALNSEPTKTEPKIEKVTTSIGILSDSWDMDRVSYQAAPDLYTLYLKESKNAIIRKFNATVISGDTKKDANGFDGLDKAIKGSSTEFTSETDLSTVTEAAALAWAEEMDTLFSALTRTPDALMVGPVMKTKINAICRVLGLATTTADTAGKQVSAWNGVRIEELKDGAIATNDVYAVCFGLNEFHGITLKGDNAVTLSLPDWEKPGAVKSGDAEIVCGCALKATKAAGVLRAKPAGSGSSG